MTEEFSGLTGTVCLVTGAAKGIGEGVARTLHAAGMRLAVSDVNGDGVAALAEELGGNIIAFPLDVTDGAAVEAFVAETEERLGPIGGLAHVVGIQRFGTIAELSEADFDVIFTVNVKGTFLVAQAIARRMHPRKRGAIVAIASTAARTPRVGQGAYCSSKAAVAQMMCVLGLELAPSDIRVNCVSPGVTDTGMVQRLMATMPIARGRHPGQPRHFPRRRAAWARGPLRGDRRRGRLPAFRPLELPHHAGYRG